MLPSRLQHLCNATKINNSLYTSQINLHRYWCYISVGPNVLYISFLARNIVSRKHFKYPLHKEYLILNRDDAKKNENLERGSYRKLKL